MSPAEITAYLHEQFPLAAAMRIRTDSWDGRTLKLAAPLEPNLNHAQSAFGGSISTLAITTGWMLLHLLLLERQVSNRLLIQKSSIDYNRPIEGMLRAAAHVPKVDELNLFLEVLHRRRKARITLETVVYDDTVPAAIHSGTYVAILY